MKFSSNPFSVICNNQNTIVDGESSSASNSSHDDSTLHGSASCSVKYQIRSPTQISQTIVPNGITNTLNRPKPVFSLK